MARARSVEIYLKCGIQEDDQVHAIWASLRGRARPQDIFRRALRLGLQAMAQAGELPRVALESTDMDLPGPDGKEFPIKGPKARTRVDQINPSPDGSAPLEKSHNVPGVRVAETAGPIVLQSVLQEPVIKRSQTAGIANQARSLDSSPGTRPVKGRLGKLMG